MILASVAGGGPDGTLVVVSADRSRFVLPVFGPRTLQAALDEWDRYRDGLEATYETLSVGDAGLPTGAATFVAPLPRAYHWAEGSCYLSHMERIRASRGEALPADHRRHPKVYQSGSDAHLAPVSEVELPDPSSELDLEATVVVVTGRVGRAADRDRSHILLVGLTNDLTYRRHIVEERREGSGIYRSKPGRAYAPFAVTPSGLSALWTGSSLQARVRTEINGNVLGEPWAHRDLAFDFDSILTHLTETRALEPGSIVGLGTVSNTDPRTGVGCIAERRALDIEAGDRPVTEYLKPGDTLSIEALDDDGASIFGRIHQTIVRTRQGATGTPRAS